MRVFILVERHTYINSLGDDGYFWITDNARKRQLMLLNLEIKESKV